VADHRGPSHRTELPLGTARWGAGALPGRQRGSAVVAATPGPRARAAECRHPGSLPGHPDLPEDRGALWLSRSLGSQAHARMGGHRREGRPAAAGERAPLLHRQLQPRWRRRGVRHQPAGRSPAQERTDVPGQQLRHRGAASQPGAARWNGQRLAPPLPSVGDEGHAAARQPLPDAGSRPAG
jgi:hypothetical protein